MKNFSPLFQLELKRRSKDFFIIFYSVVFPIVIIALLGYLTSKSYGVEFTSYEYYSIVLIPFCLFMGITSVAYAAVDEKRMRTSCRYIISPISKASLSFIQLMGIDMGISYGNLILTGIWLSGIATAFGTFIAYENMPTMLQKISIISPLRWFIDMTKKMETGISWFENIQQVVVLSVMILTFLIAASLINIKQKAFQ